MLELSEKFHTLKNKRFMSHSTYLQLPQESLNELLCMAVKDMLTTLDTNDEGKIGLNATRKQVELLLDIIDEKAKAKKSPPSIPKTSDF